MLSFRRLPYGVSGVNRVNVNLAAYLVKLAVCARVAQDFEPTDVHAWITDGLERNVSGPIQNMKPVLQDK